MRALRFSHSTLGRMAAAMMNPRKSRAMTALIFHRARAATTIDSATRVAVAARRGIAAVGAVAAVWRWDRTRVVLTGERLFVVHGTIRRRAAAVRLEKV